MAGKDSPPGIQSESGQAESAEPSTTTSSVAATTTTASSTPAPRRTTPTLKPTTSTTIPQPPILRKSSSSNLAPAGSPLPGSSPRTSRNTSPLRKEKSGSLATNTATANASAFQGPPSAASIQRALSASNMPQLVHSHSSPEITSKLPRRKEPSVEPLQQVPPSPRVRSPPPSTPTSRRNSNSNNASQKKADAPASTSSTNASSSSTAAATPKPSEAEPAKSEKSPQPPPAIKISSRATSGKPALETVQETSSDTIAEPSPAVMQATADLKPLTSITEESQASSSKTENADGDRQQPTESGSESAGNKSDGAGTTRGRRPSSNAPTHLSQRQSRPNTKPAFPLTSTKVRPAEGKQNMTVETETVQSIPQSGLTAGERSTGPRNDGGSVRLKPSTETIRPKKERKKADRKPRSINQGTATSKADLFEARVASAVDEVSTSDSDETFVYESNPPEQQRRQRHHSRTPSVASQHSVADQGRGAMRGFGDTYDGRRLGGKRSMKFSTNAYHDTDSPESTTGTVRSHTPRHIGRFGRNGHLTNTHDQSSDSAFTLPPRQGNHLTATHGRSHHNGGHGPDSPRSPHTLQYRPGNIFGSKPEQPYDFDAGANADDETAPLLRGARGNRAAYRSVRRLAHRSAAAPGDYPDHGHYSRRHRYYPDDFDGDDDGALAAARTRRARISACVVTTAFVVLVLASAVGFVLSASRPLRDVRVRSIEHVLASEQELLFDLVVAAANPNTLAITVAEADLDIFARSKHFAVGGNGSAGVGEEILVYSARRQIVPMTSEDLSNHWHPPVDEPRTLPRISSSGGHDHGTDPIPGDGDDDDDSQPADPPASGGEHQTLFLGRAFHLDQGLLFPAAPLLGQTPTSRAVASLRVRNPGNSTEADGSAKWERVVGFPFELILKGTLKYRPPLGATAHRPISVAIAGSVMVHPEERTDPGDGGHDGDDDGNGKDPDDDKKNKKKKGEGKDGEPLDDDWRWVEWPEDGRPDGDWQGDEEPIPQL